MYNHFCALSFNPFDKTVPVQTAFQSKDHTEMQNRLSFIKSTRGIGLFTAPPGMGKTYALRCFAENLNPNLSQMVYTCLSTISVTEFYRQMCVQLGIEPVGRKTEMFRMIQERVRSLLKEKHKTLMVAIDECQYLNNDTILCFLGNVNSYHKSFFCYLQYFLILLIIHIRYPLS